MSKFCKYCYNILYPNVNNDELVFKCMSCHEVYPAEANDSLRYERTKEANISRFEKILNNTADDPAVLKARIQCVKCDNDIIKQVRIGQDMKLFNVCPKCNTKWIY
jgi:DNA-directed RNA polymerase subunit M/transcription elongation factor TFIIS